MINNLMGNIKERRFILLKYIERRNIMSKQEDYLKKYLGFDLKDLEDLYNLDEIVKSIVEKNQSKDDKQKALNAIRAEYNYLNRNLDNSKSSSISIFTLGQILVLFAVCFDVINSMIKDGHIGISLFHIVAILAIILILECISKNATKEFNTKNENLKKLDYIKSELERICKNSESNQ